MEQVTMFTQLGKVPHDDAPDSLAQLADELYNGISKIEPVKRPFLIKNTIYCVRWVYLFDFTT